MINNKNKLNNNKKTNFFFMLMPNTRYDQLYPIKFTRIQSPKLVIAGDTIVLKTGPD